MLETFGRVPPRVTFDSSSMTISSGNARVGNTFVYYDGTRASYNETASFSGSTGYRNVMLYLNYDGIVTDMTRVLSDATGQVNALRLPVIPSTTGYADGYPIGMLTFQSSDGTNATLTSYRLS